MSYRLVTHFLTYVTIKKKSIKYEKVTFTCRSYANFNEQLLKDKLSEIDWTVYYEIKEPEDCWEFIYTKLLQVFDEICPEKSHTNIRKKSERLTADLFALMRERERKYKIARRLNTVESWQEAKQYQNFANEACKLAKNSYVKNKLKETAGNTRKFWEILKPLIGKNDDDKQINIDLADIGNNPNAASAFNQFFVNVGESLQRDIPELNDQEKIKLDELRDEYIRQTPEEEGTIPLFSFRPIVDLEIERIVKKIEIHKSSGIDRLPSYLIKLCFRILIQQIT